jgi:hypothetical protein
MNNTLVEPTLSLVAAIFLGVILCGPLAAVGGVILTLSGITISSFNLN